MKNYLYIIVGLFLIAVALTLPGADTVASLTCGAIGVVIGIISRIVK